MKKLLWVVAPTGICFLHLAWFFALSAIIPSFIALLFAFVLYLLCYGIVLYWFLNKHENGYIGKAFLLIIGFVLLPVIAFIMEYPDYWLLMTFFAIVSAGPCIVVTIIVMIALKVKEKRFQRKGREKIDAGQD